MKHYCIDLKTVHELQQYMFDFSCKAKGHIELSIPRIYSFMKAIDEVITKLLTCGYYDEFNKIFEKESVKDRIKIFLELSQDFYCYKEIPPIRGPCALAYDYYVSGGGYLRNHYFLFGTPSQFRLKR